MADASIASLGGLLGGKPDQGALWNSLTNNGQWLPAQAPDDVSATAQPSAAVQPAPQPHGLLGHIAANVQALGGLFGSNAPVQATNDLLAQYRPGALQTFMQALGAHTSLRDASDDLTQRNLARAMLPYQIQNQALQAANQRAIGELVYRKLHPASTNLQQAGGQPGGATYQPAVATSDQSGAGAPQTAPSAGGGLDQDTLGLMTLAGYPNADKAWTVMAPETEITRDGVIYNKKDPTGRIIGMAPHPQYINGQWVDVNSKGAPGFIPQYAQGTMPDGNGGVIPIPGYASAVAEAAGTTERAKQAAAAPYDMVTVNINGSPVTMSKAQFASLQGVNGVPVEAAQGGPAAAPASAPASAPQPAQGGSRTITPQQAMRFYIAKGYKPEQAAGIVGNLIGESGLDAGQTADDGSFGLAQWTGPRLQGLFSFAKRNKLDPSDPNTQLEYSAYEMQNGEKSAGDAIRSAGNVNDATAAAVGYERPAGYTPQNPQGASGYGRRLIEAQQLASGGAGSATTPSAQPAPGGKGVIAQGVNEATQKADQEAIADLRKDVQARRLLASRANEFVSKMGDFATGPAYGGIHIPMTHSEFSPIKDAMSLIPNSGNKIDELDAISNSTWQDLRQQGSGGIRGFEAGGWKQAFPNIENYGPANVDIAKRLTAEQRQKEAELAFKEGWLQKYGSLSANGGADAAWSKMPIASNALADQEQPPQKAPPSRGPKLPARAPALPRAQTAGGIDPRAIADLRRDHSPQAQAEFDQVFGKGSAKRVLGGA